MLTNPKKKKQQLPLDPLWSSHIYSSNLEYNDTKFHSVEQAYQYTRAIALHENIIADEIMTK
jgi:hypothetical protein